MIIYKMLKHEPMNNPAFLGKTGLLRSARAKKGYCFLFCKDTFSVGSQAFCRYINIFAVGIVVKFYGCSAIIVCFYIGCPVKCAPEILHGGSSP